MAKIKKHSRTKHNLTFTDFSSAMDRYRKPSAKPKERIEHQPDAINDERKYSGRSFAPLDDLGQKYELIECNRKYKHIQLLRVRALRDFAGVKAGDVGGCIEGPHNLSQNGTCWLSYDCVIIGRGRLQANGRMRGRAVIRDNGFLGADAYMQDNTVICGNGIITGTTELLNDVIVGGNIKLGGDMILRNRDELTEYLDSCGSRSRSCKPL